MQKLVSFAIFLGISGAAVSLYALSAEEKDKAHAGANASSEGGVSLGGTGIDSGVANPRGTDQTDKRIKLQRKPKPEPELKDPEGPKPSERGSSSRGAGARNSTDLSLEADKQDEEFRKKQGAQRRK
jgi:hypothetical protein